MLLGCMQPNQEPKREHSLVLRGYRLRRDATVLSKVVSFPVGYDGHLRLISLHPSSCQRFLPAAKSWIPKAQWAQLSIMMETTCVLRYCLLFKPTGALISGAPLFWDLYLSLVHFLSLHTGYLNYDIFAWALGNAPSLVVPFLVHSLKLFAKTWAVCGVRDWRNWNWWQTEIKHNQVQFTRSKVKVFLSFLFASDCRQQLTSAGMLIDNIYS